MSVLEVFDVLRRAEDQAYIGEAVSQLTHALQGAFFARRAAAEDEEVLAILLHDIGHLCAPDSAPRMDGLGVMDHEELGAQYLAAHGFSPKVCALVAGHVQAKRYLVWKNARYADNLSEASQGTLAFQGGPMNDDEAAAFQCDALFAAKLRVRSWDEQAKRVDLEVPPIDSYLSLALDHVSSASAESTER